jgi:phosphoglycerate dehydrogenase-like enzyme
VSLAAPLRVLVAPRGTRDWLRDAVVAGGGVVVDDAAAADAVVWTSPRDPAGLAALLAAHPQLSWVQLPWSGIEHYLALLAEQPADDTRLWTAGQGIYAKDVAEHALALMLAGLRDLKKRATATSWQPPSGLSLHGARVTIFGAGGIAQELMPLLAPFSPVVTVVRRKREAFAGAARVLTLDERVDAVADADVVVVALALTPETQGLIGARELAAMKQTALLVNVARGGHVDTAALVTALRARALGGACLDVTDPEPLPDDHALFHLDNCLITPHCANTPEMAVPVLTARVRDNVRRRIAGEPLLGVIDRAAGY